MSRLLPHAARAALALALAAAAAAATAQQPRLAVVRLSAGIHNIEAEVAQTPQQRATGLMHRRSMAAHQGMLFVFDPPARVHCFWMKDTPLPLSIAFVADDGTVVDVADMQPGTTEQHCPRAPVRYALEMNRGWFAKRGIGPGAKLSGPPFGRP